MEPITLVSFGYKHTVPPENAGAVIDCREMKNPHSDPHLRRLTGRDAAVQGFVAQDPNFKSLIGYALERARFGGVVAFGCFGGRHRSVAMAEIVHNRLKAMGHDSKVLHTALAC